MLKRLLGLGLSLTVAACASTGISLSPDASADRFEKDVSTLASDAYEGRAAGEPGYEMAADYVVDAFAKIGLQPAGTEGYRQSVPLRKAFRETDGATLEIKGNRKGEQTTLVHFEDFTLSAARTQEEVDVTAPVVFVGYGIDAPSFGISSYEGVNVRGKIVAMLGGAPDGLPSEEAAHLSSWRTKRATAAANGAIGMVVLEDEPPQSGQEARARSLIGLPTYMVHPSVSERDLIDAVANLTKSGTDAVLEAAGIPAAEIFGEAPQSRPLNVSLRLAGKTRFEDFEADNIVGKIEGTDSSLKDEAVILTAHLDHIGMLSSVEEGVDVINNGAMDNATGVATLLEAARTFMASGEPPKRSVVFVALTAEERGLLGSEYFAQNPPAAVGEMVANVNLDMPIILYEFVDVIAFGAQHSTLKGVVEEAASAIDVAVIEDPVPNLALFVRSDHYNFVKQGVPSVFLFVGFGNGGEAAFQSFMANHYHRPSDQPDLPMLWHVGAKFAKLNYEIARVIADAPEKPEWDPESFFADLTGGETGM